MNDYTPKNDYERIGRALGENELTGITALEFLRYGGGMKLASRISELRRRGHNITGKMEKNGRGGRHMRYFADPMTAWRIMLEAQKGVKQ